MNPYLRYRLKQLVHTLGLRPPRALAKRTSAEAFCQHLKARGFEPVSIIDVGVAHGTFEIYLTFPQATFLLIEPMEEFRPAIDWIANHYKCYVEYVAAGRQNTSGTVYFDGGSDSRLHGASLAYDKTALTVEGVLSRRVPVKRLDDMVAAYGLKGPMLLKVDTQGFEHEVIAGAEGILPMVEVVILEVGFFRFVPNQLSMLETIQMMADKGFSPYEIFGGGNRPLDGAASHLDMAFVRTDGIFRRDHRYV